MRAFILNRVFNKIINVFTVTFDQFNAPLLNKTSLKNAFLKKKNNSDPKHLSDMSVCVSLNVFLLWFKNRKRAINNYSQKKKSHSNHINRLIKHKELLYPSLSLSCSGPFWNLEQRTMSAFHIENKVYSENPAVTCMHNKHTVKHTLHQLQMHSCMPLVVQ